MNDSVGDELSFVFRLFHPSFIFVCVVKCEMKCRRGVCVCVCVFSVDGCAPRRLLEGKSFKKTFF